MPVIRPVSDLRNKTPEIEEICINEHIPVFITKNGNGHLVIMSQQLFEEQQALLDLYEKLDEAEEQSRSGKRRPFRDVMVDIRSRIHAKASN
ncbi:type II toxin-antitoxin system Phd/YefM family antitoxin [Desulfosporosinus sp. BICA1-9]|uniref:type II toxin-antitoxin system Phd/YefM family antitoxin n=1 Tax=Desulfosporosinus sp. BICA1-9 TaxID=1531958 RepID=UPI00054BA1A3|nr:type II toxin-antitoxin system Phd/YefM family antitoxin [Desulfosporosinus sp. BICA1-9]KJS46176.1 MAG: prevent-host-death protein [Peptococcaceae bacterium BRH_c23]KJS90089.1 MAG: prevent-host-death protein [Desulfosporosinus sp. BICA1-9]HBW36328.1 type II toxin-antitoxin system Phd/YefM family antitoxin [Desulfosporosinus sp.]